MANVGSALLTMPSCHLQSLATQSHRLSLICLLRTDEPPYAHPPPTAFECQHSETSHRTCREPMLKTVEMPHCAFFLHVLP
eukprot:1747617-Amphidinium_carterae.1